IASLAALRAVLLHGTLVNSARLTLGDGASPASTWFGAPGQSQPAGSFDGPPVFQLGSGPYSVSYFSEGAPRSTGFEIPASRTVASLTLDNAAGLTLTGGSLQLTGAL